MYTLDMAKCSFYRAANAVFAKRRSGPQSKDVILELIRSKYWPALLYGLEYQFVRFCKSLFS